ncbi:MAG: FAD-binding oxidoreductase [Xanthomonadales bacterium]|nr:FAD-binding oxidoreductase [Xanthomonadales bacterium]
MAQPVPDALPGFAFLAEHLRTIVGPEQVLTDPDQCALYGADIYSRGESPSLVVQPRSTTELAAAVTALSSAGVPVIGRGGGMSYTSGYAPSRAGCAMLDLGQMNRVLEINTEDMYVTVECGCTWHELHEALKGSGLRTPFWGTLSGITATVGGGLSQNGIFWGSGQFGFAVDSVLGLEVVLADGSVVRTGAGAQVNGSPFSRHYGPDLTGLFTSDAGALGVKATATLKLIPELPVHRFASFDFENHAELISAMSRISREGLAMECFAFDPFLQSQRMQRESLAKDVKALAGVMKASGSLAGALREGARVALAGRGYMGDVQWSLHLVVEERSEQGADAALARIREICAAGREIENSIPKILRANPFTPLNNVLGPAGERWAPVHTLVPHSRAREVTESVQALFDTHAEAIETHGVGVGFLLATVSTHVFVVEPVFFWPDERFAIHEQTVEPAVLARLPKLEANPAARELVASLRGEMVDLFSRQGGIHMQIGRSYPYLRDLDPATRALVEALKQAMDPEGTMNPGSLGLG